MPPSAGTDPDRALALEALAAAAYADEPSITEVIRPAAVVPERAARAIVAQLELRDARRDGRWVAATTSWRLFDRPWSTQTEPGEARLVGTLQLAHGTPTRFDITVYRVTITAFGAAGGWSVSSLTDEALAYGGLTLATCPRATLRPPPPVFRVR